MIKLKTIDDYLSSHTLPECYPWVRELLDAIEREVDGRFMELPVDADGVPLHLNDEVCSLVTERTYFVTGVADGAVQIDFYATWLDADSLRHVKPKLRTVEDVLREFAEQAEKGKYSNDMVAKYAAELRMAGDVE